MLPANVRCHALTPEENAEVIGSTPRKAVLWALDRALCRWERRVPWSNPCERDALNRVSD
jgi:hypothetical protein